MGVAPDGREHDTGEPVKGVEKTARSIAISAHRDQVDKAGRPYIEHVTRVARSCASECCRVVGWLHDVIEDGHLSAADLHRMGIPPLLVGDVLVLTRRRGQAYTDYIKSIVASGSGVALIVKRADLKDNLRPGVTLDLERRYLSALGEIETAIEVLASTIRVQP